MKRLCFLLIFTFAFALSGCAEDKKSNNIEKNADNEIIWKADINHDGSEDKIIVEILNDGNTGEGAKISVYNNSDLLIYSDKADLPHAGWNGFYLYSDENGVYLFNWQPVMYQGYGNYTYEIFSFDDKGDKVVLNSDSFDFNVNDICYEYKGLEDFVKYIQRVNAYIASSYLIVDTDGGVLLYGTQDSRIVNPYVPKWLFNIF